MKIRFLGTNGWYSSKTGLTPCILIDCEEGYIIFDAGEGIQKLDKYITDDKKPIYLFLSHFHLEHIHGLHILDKFDFKQGIKIIGKVGIKEMTNLIVNTPFTNSLKNLPYNVYVMEVEEGKHKDPIKFKCALFPHHDPSMGYKLEIEGKSITYCTDLGQTEKLIEFAKDSDVFITECSFTLDEKISPSWSHMNPEKAAQTAKGANVKKLILTHFGAHLYLTIKQRKEAEKVAKNIFKNTTAALDDMEIEV